MHTYCVQQLEVSVVHPLCHPGEPCTSGKPTELTYVPVTQPRVGIAGPDLALVGFQAQAFPLIHVDFRSWRHRVSSML